ncbi:MAG: hypothetical protein II037_13280 [Bacteroidales bacterium]|nr:hypothetical protein [Bacteroidales bacterium]
MSGGILEYSRWQLEEIVEQIGEEIAKGNDEYTDDTLFRLREAQIAIAKATIYLNRVDYLLSGDDDEESFKERLDSELADIG